MKYDEGYLEKVFIRNLFEEILGSDFRASYKSDKKDDDKEVDGKDDIINRIKKNSSGVVGRETALTSKTWVAVLKSSLGNDNDASIAIQPVFKAWTGMPQFDSVSTAADSVQNNYNDWYRLLS